MGRGVVLVGHGPSLLQRKGQLIDQHIVVRCKRLPVTDPAHWAKATHHAKDPADFGVRTDYLLTRQVVDLRPQLVEQWLYPAEGWPKWNEYFAKYSDYRKYSHGLAAVFQIVERLKPAELHVIGCDRLMGRFRTLKAWGADRAWDFSKHDWPAEHQALMDLKLPIIEL